LKLRFVFFFRTRAWTVARLKTKKALVVLEQFSTTTRALLNEH